MRKSPKLKWIIAAVVGLCILLSLKSFIHVGARTGNFEDDKRLATAAVERFHAELDAGQYQAIYDEATPTFQNADSQSALIAAMAQSKQKFGNVVNAVQVGANAFPGGQVRFVYNTQFEKGPATELFIWQSDGQKASLMRYQIFPGTVKPRFHSRP
jgi:acyl-homoserine lactone acylase PvdQ